MPLTHAILLVDDLASCVRFYRDLLDFRPVSGDERGPYAVLSSGAQTLGLFDANQRPALLGGALAPAGGSRTVLAYMADDVDALVARLVASGVRFALQPHDFPEWGVRSALCLDPAGNPIEIYRPLAR